MPLSDEERQRLDDIEQALRQDDPEFAANVSMFDSGAARSSSPALCSSSVQCCW